MGALRILLVVNSVNEFSYIAKRLLAEAGIECRFAGSYKRARMLLEEETFDLIISEMRLLDASASQMIPLLEGVPDHHVLFAACGEWLLVAAYGRKREGVLGRACLEGSRVW